MHWENRVGINAADHWYHMRGWFNGIYWRIKSSGNEVASTSVYWQASQLGCAFNTTSELIGKKNSWVGLPGRPRLKCVPGKHPGKNEVAIIMMSILPTKYWLVYKNIVVSTMSQIRIKCGACTDGSVLQGERLVDQCYKVREWDGASQLGGGAR